MTSKNITVRTRCNGGRATYHPEWSTSNPWICYIDGEAIIHQPTLEACAQWFAAKRMVLIIPTKELL